MTKLKQTIVENITVDISNQNPSVWDATVKWWNWAEWTSRSPSNSSETRFNASQERMVSKPAYVDDKCE